MPFFSPIPPTLRDLDALRSIGVKRVILQAMVTGGITGGVIGLFRFSYDHINEALVQAVHRHNIYDPAVAACLFGGLAVLGLLALPGGFGMRLMAANLLFTVLNLFKAAAYVLLLGLLLRMVLSFSKPYSPLLPVLHRIFEPLSRPFVFLKIGRFDFSGSVLVLVLWFWLSAILPQMISRLNLWLLG